MIEEEQQQRVSIFFLFAVCLFGFFCCFLFFVFCFLFFWKSHSSTQRENKLSLISDEHELDSLEPPYAEGESHLYESDLSLEGEDLFDQNEQTVAEESVKQVF